MATHIFNKVQFWQVCYIYIYVCSSYW